MLFRSGGYIGDDTWATRPGCGRTLGAACNLYNNGARCQVDLANRIPTKAREAGQERESGSRLNLSLPQSREAFTRRLAPNDNPLGRKPLHAFSRSLHTHHPQTHWFGLTPRSGATTSSAAVPSVGALGYALSSFGLAPPPPLNRCKLSRPNSPRRRSPPSSFKLSWAPQFATAR